MSNKENLENTRKIDLKGKKFTDSNKVFENFLSSKAEEIIELNLSYNNLTRLPDNLSHFKCLQIIDLTNNQFENFEKTAFSLSTLPSLIDLSINLSNHNEALIILDTLPNLLFLNGKSTKEENYTIDIDDKEIEPISLNEEISNFNLIFSKLSEKFILIKKEKNQSILEEFQNILKTQITKINNTVDNGAPNYIYVTNIISTKLKIFNYFQNKYLELLDYTDKDKAESLRDIGDSILKSSEFLINIVTSLHSKIEEQTNNIKKEFNNALKTAKSAELKIFNYEEKLKLSNKEKEFLIVQNTEEKSILLKRIDSLENENKIMTEKLMKNAKELINTSQTKNKLSSNNVPEKTKDEINLRESNMNISNLSGVNESMMKSRIINNNTTMVINQNGTKVLTIKIMKDIINEIYVSKVEFDKKCLESKIAKETMEQHMYTYLNQKYGLKSLIVEWASSIINGIKMYSSEDSEVCLFGKILRNELDEETILILNKLKTTLNDLLLYTLKAKFPMKSNKDIKDLFNERINGFIMEEEWKKMIMQIYEDEDVINLENKIQETIKKKGVLINKNGNFEKKLSREEIMNISKNKDENKISFKDFQKCILDYQIKSRDRYLKNFVSSFRKSDKDNNGVINEEEFYELLTNIKIYGELLEENAVRLLNIIDPNNNKQIIFSDCVSLFKMVYNHFLKINLKNRRCFRLRITIR